jgi:PAS domain S-box-containing protein
METAIQLSDQGLHREAEALRLIVEMLPTGVLVTDANGKLLFHNQAAHEILGAADAACGGPSEWTSVFGWYTSDKTTLLSPEELPLVRALRGEEIHDELVFVRNTHRPEGIWISATGRPMRAASGSISAGIMLFRDVTQRRMSQQTSVLLSQVVEKITDSVFVTDKEGLIKYVNPAFEAMTGFSQEDVAGNPARILTSDVQDPVFHQRLWDDLSAGRPFRATISNRKKNGEVYQAEQTITPITDDEGNLTHFVAVMQDVTEALIRQEREVQLRLARQIQKKFFRTPPTVHGFDLAAAAYPAYETSGDYFDFIPLGGNRLGIAVGDVEGHGFGSAMVMALTRAYVHSFAAMGLEVDQILTQVNRMLVKDLGDGCFVTMMLACLDVGDRSLVYAGAGHLPGYVLNGSGPVEHTLESSGPPLGLFPDVTFSRGPSITLHPGQLMVLLTDGITESSAADGSEWGASGARAER